MNEDIKSLSIYPENCEFESDYLPLISFKTQQQKDIAEKYILTKVRVFFNKVIKIALDVEKSQITYPKVITEKDFKAKPVSYFYENIFFDLGKRDSDNRLKFFPKWGITFDEQCAPIEVSWLSPKFIVKYDKPDLRPFSYYYDSQYYKYEWHYKYGTIDINGLPFFYYIYFTLQEILDEIKRKRSGG